MDHAFSSSSSLKDTTSPPHPPSPPITEMLIPICYPFQTVTKSVRGLGKHGGHVLLTPTMYLDLFVSRQKIRFQHGYAYKNCSDTRYCGSADFRTLLLVQM